MRMLLCLSILAVPFFAQVHPLDSLTTSEFWTVYETLQKAGHGDADTVFSSILLHPPSKQAVLTNQPVPRQADVILRKGNKSFAALVNITAKSVVSHQELKDAQAPFTLSELLGSDGPIKKDPRVIEALKKRGITDLRTVQCVAVPVAYRSTPEQATQRVGFAGCSKTNGTLHTWGRSIEGLTIEIDVVTNKIIRVVDKEIAPVPTADNNYEEIPEVPRPHTTPIFTSQPMGPGYKINKGEISWQNWNFRFRLDQRVGTVLNLVKVLDKGKLRSVMYEGHVSELFVPYMDPANGWNNRAFIDAGQFYAVSPFIKPLKIGLDCPATATYFDAVFATDSGSPKLHNNLACLFERSLDTPAWRHGEDGQIFGRPDLPPMTPPAITRELQRS
jgi:primary-amine oxidase